MRWTHGTSWPRHVAAAFLGWCFFAANLQVRSQSIGLVRVGNQVEGLQPASPPEESADLLPAPARAFGSPSGPSSSSTSTLPRWWFLLPASRNKAQHPSQEIYQPRWREHEKRKFPEVDSRGFDEDIFDEGFGEFHPMKRWS